MELLVKRIARKDKYTIGRMFVDGAYFCDTLEDKDRYLHSFMAVEDIRDKKVYGQTAIPDGKYELTLNVISPKYERKPLYKALTGGYMPRLEYVKGFIGVLIHGGNSPEDTEGCILVGENKVVGGLVNSFNTFKKLYKLMDAAWKRKEKITLTII